MNYDVCVIGSGAGAGPIIYELSGAGLKVCVLEKGDIFNEKDFSKDEKKEMIFAIIKNNDYAKSWVSKLTYYGIEAMFSDPLYGGNTNQIGWSSTNHSIGYPRPVKTYGQKI